VAECLVACLRNWPGGWDGPPVAVLPRANPDGLVRGTRTNARGVDLNRNFAARNWRPGVGGPRPESEPETRAVLRAIATTAPARIVSIHSITPGRACNNYDGPARRIARAMHLANGYPVVDRLGPCPGSLGNWAGVDRGVPIITLELPRGVGGREAWEANREALLLVVRQEEAAVLARAESGEETAPSTAASAARAVAEGEAEGPPRPGGTGSGAPLRPAHEAAEKAGE